MSTRNRRAGGVQDRTADATKRAFTSWAVFTWAADTAKAFRAIPHVLLNWLVLAGLAFAWWSLWDTQWKVLLGVTLLGLIYTIGRATRWVPKTRATILSIYTSTAKTCGHPRITRTQPVDPRTRVKVTRWGGPTKPKAGLIAYESDSYASSPSTRYAAEKVVEAVAGSEGVDVVFDYDSKPGWMQFTQVPADDPRVAQKSTRRWVESAIAQIITVRKSAGNTLDITVEWAEPGPPPTDSDSGDPADLTNGRPDVPGVITVDYGAHDIGGQRGQSDAEVRFDQTVSRGVEWLHDWSMPGVWTITAALPSSDPAVQKRTARKVSSVVRGAVQSTGGMKAVAQTSVDVTGWTPDTAAAAVRNTPTEVTVDLGVADFSNLSDQHRVEGVIDRALEAEWPDRAWLPEWRIAHATMLVIKAVPASHPMALRKKETLRLRSVAQQKIRPKRGETPANVEVTEWKALDGAEQAAQMVVSFGTADVTDPDTRRKFEDHFDSLTQTNDWRYEWEAAQGRVHVTAVPVLPGYLPFPEEGTDECRRWHEAFRDGKIILGPAKGGYEAMIDLSKTPHTLVGGETGKGKSVLLTLVLHGALMNPDIVDLIVVDPKVTDFTWTPGYPNVRMYAVKDVRTLGEEIHAVTDYAVKAMNARQSLLLEYGVENLSELRRGITNGTITGITLDEVPKRLILFFDEGGAAFTPVKDPDLKAMQDAARTNMENLGMLARAMEVNIVMAAQKPSANNIGTALRAQMGNRIAIGTLGTNESIQVLDNTLATKGLAGAPRGRGWFVNDAGQELMIQTYYLPKRDTPDIEDSTRTISGVQERVATRLGELGWTSIDQIEDFTRVTEKGETIPTQVRTTKWVRLDRVDTEPEPSDEAGMKEKTA